MKLSILSFIQILQRRKENNPSAAKWYYSGLHVRTFLSNIDADKLTRGHGIAIEKPTGPKLFV